MYSPLRFSESVTCSTVLPPLTSPQLEDAAMGVVFVVYI